jgi:hypothetical protein
MDFSMPVWSSAKARGVLLAALLLGSVPAWAEFNVSELHPRLSADTLTLDGDLELGLSNKVEEALSKGIELPLILEIRLYRKREWLWDRRVAEWSLRRSLRFHALSGQYLVSADTEESFSSLNGALRYLGHIGDLQLKLPADEKLVAGEYTAELRVHLDIEALPPPLRPVAYTNLSWHLNSGWSAWNVAQPTD